MKELPHLASSDAARILGRMKPEHSFKLHSGSDIQNLQGLLEALKVMPDSTFRYHVTKDRNDFSRWIMDAVGDEELAEEIKNVKSKEELRRKVEARIGFLEQISSETGISAFFMRHAVLESAFGFVLGLLAGLLLARLL